MFALATRHATRDPFETLSRDFDRMLRGYYGESEIPSALAPYPVDLREDDDHFYVEAELPGFTKEEINVTLENGNLTIHAERKIVEKSKKGQPLHEERVWTRFERTFTLPTAVNENTVKADLKSGVLAITLDKRAEVKPRKILIHAEDGKPAISEGSHKA
ncbi:MAG: Hsp20/alpha crystallin family protein [Phycisphaerae bacterium]